MFAKIKRDTIWKIWTQKRGWPLDHQTVTRFCSRFVWSDRLDSRSFMYDTMGSRFLDHLYYVVYHIDRVRSPFLLCAICRTKEEGVEHNDDLEFELLKPKYGDDANSVIFHVLLAGWGVGKNILSSDHKSSKQWDDKDNSIPHHQRPKIHRFEHPPKRVSPDHSWGCMIYNTEVSKCSSFFTWIHKTIFEFYEDYFDFTEGSCARRHPSIRTPFYWIE